MVRGGFFFARAIAAKKKARQTEWTGLKWGIGGAFIRVRYGQETQAPITAASGIRARTSGITLVIGLQPCPTVGVQNEP